MYPPLEFGRGWGAYSHKELQIQLRNHILLPILNEFYSNDLCFNQSALTYTIKYIYIYIYIYIIFKYILIFVEDTSTPQPELEADPPRALVKEEIKLHCIVRVTTGTQINFSWKFQNSSIKVNSRVPVEWKSSVCLICMK